MNENPYENNSVNADPSQPQQGDYPYQQQSGYPYQQQPGYQPQQQTGYQQSGYPYQQQSGGYQPQQQSGYQQSSYPYQQQAGYPYQQQNMYQAQPQPGYSYPQNSVTDGPMPSQGLYLVLLVIGFLCGILWGALSLGPYQTMKTAIANNDGVTARANAKKILIFTLIGVAINALIIIGRIAAAS